MIGLGWLAYVRADYRDSANNESHILYWYDIRTWLLPFFGVGIIILIYTKL